jgi:GNAT superfamily N-acetyltransferase
VEGIDIQRLAADGAAEVAHMTFPAYRHLLSLQPAPRHPGQGDTALVQPVANLARLGAEPVGLILTEVPFHRQHEGEILSVFVVESRRGQGVATALVTSMEDRLRRGGLQSITAVYMSGGPSIPAIERVFAKCGWSAPEVRALSVRFTPQEAMRTPWFGRVALRDADFEIVAWKDVRPEERAAAREAHERAPWVRQGLEFWNHDHYGFDEVSSLGLRYHGQLVGWVINHRIAPGQVRFTCSFMREDLSRRGRILPLYTESVRRLADEGCELCTLITPVWYNEMAEFLRRRCAHVVTFFGETRGVHKRLRVPGSGEAE